MVYFSKSLIAAVATASVVQALPQAPKPFVSVTPDQAAKDAAAAADKKKSFFTNLLTAPTAVKRFQQIVSGDGGNTLLKGDDLKKAVVFNFNGTPKNNTGGLAVPANIETFPILAELGISVTTAFMNPCGINTPHIHPRATEFLTVVDGQVQFGYVLENSLLNDKSSPEISSVLNKFEGTVFPMGSIHYQFNPTCEPATFVAALNHEDAGTSQIAQNFFNLNGGVVNATLGFPETLNGQDLESFKNKIPANLAQDVNVCLTKCGLAPNQGKPKDQGKSQQQGKGDKKHENGY